MAKEGQEPLLQNGTGEASTSGDSDLVWEGTTWQGCGDCLCLAPLFCSTWKWHITSQRIDLTHGFCASSIDTLDLRRIRDIHFHRSIFQMCLGRGTISIHSANDELPELQLTTFGTEKLFHKLKDAWTRAKIATVEGEHHHM